MPATLSAGPLGALGRQHFAPAASRVAVLEAILAEPPAGGSHPRPSRCESLPPTSSRGGTCLSPPSSAAETSRALKALPVAAGAVPVRCSCALTALAAGRGQRAIRWRFPARAVVITAPRARLGPARPRWTWGAMPHGAHESVPHNAR